jgi:hypothetical protein
MVMNCIDWSYSKYIVLSSLLFQIPAYYAYRHGLYVHATGSFITTILSVNHWRRHEHGLRRKIDVVWARSAGILFLIDGMYHSFMKAIFLGMMMNYMYYLARKNQQNPYGNWYMYHMMFHAMAVTGQLSVMYYRLN